MADKRHTAWMSKHSACELLEKKNKFSELFVYHNPKMCSVHTDFYLKRNSCSSKINKCFATELHHHTDHRVFFCHESKGVWAVLSRLYQVNTINIHIHSDRQFCFLTDFGVHQCCSIHHSWDSNKIQSITIQFQKALRTYHTE